MADQFNIPDVQGTVDHRKISIDKVGIKEIHHPTSLPKENGEEQPTVSVTNMYVNLSADQKGTHMSRFIPLIEGLEMITVERLSLMLDEISDLLESEDAFIEMKMPFFIKKEAPISKVASLMSYQIRFEAEKILGEKLVWTEFLVPVTSLCPCSKKISKFGAHNQRSHLIVKLLLQKHQSYESIIREIESEASSELYGVLKRPDEKFVTERAYENPKFVEDIVRDVALKMEKNKNVLAYSVSSENFESIHNHSAYALLQRDKRQ